MQDDATFWQMLARWAWGIVATVVALAASLVARVFQQSAKRAHDRMDEHGDRIRDLETKVGEHSTALAENRLIAKQAEAERAEIKKALGDLSDKVETLPERLWRLLHPNSSD